MGLKKGIGGLVKGVIMAGDGIGCILWGIGEYTFTSLKKGIFNTCYEVTGSQELRNKLYSELEERAGSVEERETRDVFIMPKGKIAFGLGRNEGNNGEGCFSLDIYNLGRVNGYKNLKSCKHFFGEGVYNYLINEKPNCVTRYKSSLKRSRISMNDIIEPRRIYVKDNKIVTNETSQEDEVVLDSDKVLVAKEG